MAFGGCFLMMVGLDFFLDDEKNHWLPWIEQPIVFLGGLTYAAQFITISCLALVGIAGLSGEAQMSFLVAGIIGVITFTLIHAMCDLMVQKERKRATQHQVKSGFSMFVYLEVLDASFSFDGVVGAFAISTNLPIIAIGLGIGAMFVRSLTIALVEKETLTEYLYLEHGAFYAIIALACMMLLKPSYHIPQVLIGLTGAGLIGLSFVHSLFENRRMNE